MSTISSTSLLRRLSVVPALPVAALILTCVAGCGSFAAQGKNAEGVRMFEQARYEEALDQFHEAVNDDPKDADSYYNLASTHHRLGVLNSSEEDLKRAEQYYYMCHDRDPDHQECFRGRAVMLIEQGSSDEAFRLIEAWADSQPMLAEPKIELARLYEEFGDPEQAKAQLLEALAVDHENSRALAALGKLREETGDRVQALADYQRSLWHDRFQPEVAARVSALKSALDPTTLMAAPQADTQMASGGAAIVR